MDSADREESNVFVFWYGENNDDCVDARVSVFADDGLAQAWAAVQQQCFIPADRIVKISSSWAPTDADAEFAMCTFDNLRDADATWARPEPDGWDEALATVQALGLSSGQLAIPMLRTVPEPLPFSASRGLVPGQLYVTIARVTPTPRGTLQLSWVLTRQLREAGASFDQVFNVAARTLFEGLQFGVVNTETGSQVIVVEGVDPIHMPAAAIALPVFAQQMAEILGGDGRLVFGIPCHDHLYIALPDSSGAEYVAERARQPHACGSELIPTVLLMEPAGMKILRQFPAQ